MSASMNSVIQKATRIIIKVGSSLVTNDGRGLDHAAIARWAAQIAALRALGKEVVLVSSGAIAEGMLRLGFEQRPTDIHELQACAAVGQMGLAQIYETSFRAHQLGTAQVLLTHADLADRERYLNARSTLTTLLRLGVVPIINENDTVVTDEIKFGDNDTLGALVANLIEADALIILTDQHGLYSADPRKDPAAVLIAHGRAGDPALEAMAGGAGSSLGRGGMLTKILAAKRAAKSGAHTVIAYGREHRVLERLANGEAIGTELAAQTGQLTGEGKSLLPIGVVEVKGEFGRGAVITCVSESGVPVARGLSNYTSAETRRIMRKPSSEIESILGFVEGRELVHRDNLVLV
jgi:glutamate 5-kinase